MGVTGDAVELDLTAGIPYARRFRLTNGKNVWPELIDFEVRSQIRAGKSDQTELLYNLAQHITASFDGLDIALDLSLTGQNTRDIPAGYYDIVLSDPGTADVRAVPLIPPSKIKIARTVTAGADV